MKVKSDFRQWRILEEPVVRRVSAQEKSRIVEFGVQPQGGRPPHDIGHIGRLHKAVEGQHAMESLAQVLELDTLGGRNRGNIGRADGENDHLLVEHVVMAQMVQ